MKEIIIRYARSYIFEENYQHLFAMNNQINKSKGPGVYIPPPLFYVLIFIVAIFIQKRIPIADGLFQSRTIKVVGIILLIISLFFLVRSLRQFFLSKNTLILIKPASSLQTTGIYGISRNPMYVGLAIVYLGITCFIGNWWNIILFPLLFLIVQEYIIKREEKYLELEFGKQYEEYKRMVRRWL
jgi:protein-S-isoprenylcysteine O-methyltransferase Ste14